MSDAADTATERPADSGEERVFLVVVDDSEEMPVALRFACRRARRMAAGSPCLYVTERADFQHWASVGDLMRQEAREEGEQLLQKLAGEVYESSGNYPVFYIREGDVREELVSLIEEEPSISILVLAANARQQRSGAAHHLSAGQESAAKPDSDHHRAGQSERRGTA